MDADKVTVESLKKILETTQTQQCQDPYHQTVRPEGSASQFKETLASLLRPKLQLKSDYEQNIYYFKEKIREFEEKKSIVDGEIIDIVMRNVCDTLPGGSSLVHHPINFPPLFQSPTSTPQPIASTSTFFPQNAIKMENQPIIKTPEKPKEDRMTPTEVEKEKKEKSQKKLSPRADSSTSDAPWQKPERVSQDSQTSINAPEPIDISLSDDEEEKKEEPVEETVQIPGLGIGLESSDSSKGVPSNKGKANKQPVHISTPHPKPFKASNPTTLKTPVNNTGFCGVKNSRPVLPSTKRRNVEVEPSDDNNTRKSEKKKSKTSSQEPTGQPTASFDEALSTPESQPTPKRSNISKTSASSSSAVKMPPPQLVDMAAKSVSTPAVIVKPEPTEKQKKKIHKECTDILKEAPKYAIGGQLTKSAEQTMQVKQEKEKTYTGTKDSHAACQSGTSEPK